MISRDAEPIGHVPVYKRVDLWGPKASAEIIDLLTDEGRASLRHIQLREADRVWAITRQVAEGVNPPAARDSKVSAEA